MRVSLLKTPGSDNPREIRVCVKVSVDDYPQAKLDDSHFFNLKECEEHRPVAVEVFTKRPLPRNLKNYGKMLFRSLFSTDEASRARKLLKEISPPQGRVLLELNGCRELDIIPWEYAWSGNGYLVHQCIFARVRQRKEPQLPKLPLRIVAVVPDPVIPPDHPEANLPDLHLSDQFQNFINNLHANANKVTLERVFPPTVDQMESLLTKKPEMATALHFMGHCGSKNDARALIFEHNETGEHQYVDTLLHLVNVPKNLRLAFLSACDTRDIARVLFEHGVPYTIGSYCSLPDNLARKFESKFYQLLTGGNTVEMAMWRARVFLQDCDNVHQRDYFSGAMVLYSSTFREDYGAFMCEEGKPMVELHIPHNNFEVIPTTSTFHGRKKELGELNSVLRRMANRSTQSCFVCTIEGIGGQGKTALAMEAVRRTAYLFPGGIFAWTFDNEAISTVAYFQRLVDVIFPEEVKSKLRNRTDGNDIRMLGRAIFKELVSYPTCLLVLDHVDTLKHAEVLGNSDAIALCKWLREIVSTSSCAVKILATSREPLGWTGEKTIHLDGLIGLDIDSGVKLFIRNLDVTTKQRMEETETTHLLQELVRRVDGHPLSLESISHSFVLPQYQNASFEELVREHYITMLVDGSHGNRNLETRFRPTVDTLPTQQRLLLYMCSLFTGPITIGVLEFVHHFVENVDASAERIHSSSTAIEENLQHLCNRRLLSKNGDEYRIHFALKEGVRQCNSEFKLQLSLPKYDIYCDTFVIGIARPSEHGISTMLEWQLRKIQVHASDEAKNRTFGIRHYNIVDIPGTNNYHLEKDAAQQQVQFRGLVVFTRKASEMLHNSFPQFCMEEIIPTIKEKKLPFILCLNHVNIKFLEPSMKPDERNLLIMKRAAETLQASLEGTHWIVRTEFPPCINRARERSNIKFDTLSDTINLKKKMPKRNLNKDLVEIYTNEIFVGRENELENLEKLLNDNGVRYITIHGFGGIGKTSLALQAARNFTSGSVLALSLAQTSKSSQVILKIAQFLNIDIKDLDLKDQQFEVLRKLADEETILLYLDNMEDVKHAIDNGDTEKKKDAMALMGFFQRLPNNVKILATSRIALEWPDEKLVELDGLTPHDGMQVFRQWISHRKHDVDSKDAMKLSRLVHGHSLSLRLLGGVFNKCKEPFEQFIHNIGDRLPKATDSYTNDERHKSINICIQYTFDYLDIDLRSLLGELKVFEVPFTPTLAKRALVDSNTSSTASLADNLHQLWQHSWLNQRLYDPTLGDWRPRIIENDTEFYSLHPRIRDFLNDHFGNVEGATLNDAEIQFYMALCYGVGYGVVNDLEKQIEWCTKAAANGHLEAQLTLAICYDEGCSGVGRDPKKAFDWYLMAAKGGDRGAQLKLYDSYYNGCGVDKDDSESDHWKKRFSENKTAPLSIKFDLSLPLLHRTTECGQVTLIKSLMEQPLAKVDVRDRCGRTALHIAAQTGCIEVFELLAFKFCADTNAKDNNGQTPLHYARHAEVARLLVAEFGADANAKDMSGQTLLHMAAENGHAEVVRLLVAEFGADANAKDMNGQTPLQKAAENRHAEVVRLLVAEFGADANAKGTYGETPLHNAAKSGHAEDVRLLVAELGPDANAEAKMPLHKAAEDGSADYTRLLVVEFGADANAKDMCGQTPLHKAAGNGHAEVVRLLVAEFKVDANAKDNNGSTPLHKAAENGHTEVTRLLVAEFRVDANAKNNKGSTPLHRAAGNGHVNVLRFLMAESGVDASAKDNNGSTSLHISVQNGQIEVVKFLIDELSADANVRDNEGRTPLQLAIERPIHYTTRCGGCNRRITGERYKCTTCADFNFCSSCYSTPHNNIHKFYLVQLLTIEFLEEKQESEELISTDEEFENIEKSDGSDGGATFDADGHLDRQNMSQEDFVVGDDRTTSSSLPSLFSTSSMMKRAFNLQ